MSPADRETLLAIHTRLMKATMVLEDITARDETTRGPMYRLCGELMREQCWRLDGVLRPEGGPA
jgi:hypothetical protein